MNIFKKETFTHSDHILYLVQSESDLTGTGLNNEELDYIRSCFLDKQKRVRINQYTRQIFIQLIDLLKEPHQILENLRREAALMGGEINKIKLEEVSILPLAGSTEMILAYAEGLALSNYQFLKYFGKGEEKRNRLARTGIIGELVSESDCKSLNHLIKAVYKARDLVNEPVSYLNAHQLSEEIRTMGEEAGFSVDVFDIRKIQSLKMGGLLAVNKGSIDPPTFSVLEWKPENPVNTQPLVLVGKGVVYDSGGYSLKPTKNSMDYMKSDMSGAAAVAGAIYAASLDRLPVHIIGLIPATDNRPDGNAYVPGDVITMYNGMTVEVLNTDAEGRMILADALSYAKKYDPELVIDLATLTGSAAAAIGEIGIVAMSTAKSETFNKLLVAGRTVYERLVEFPLWDEYDEMIDSGIADMKNTGGKDAGAITAGKFLQRFTSYPWIHLDIAGPSFLQSVDSYRGKGGTATGLRLLYQFIKNY
jgi:leucyl aminopeptidase